MEINSLFNHFINLVLQYGFWGIFFIIVIENIGLPVPSEAAFLVGQSLVLSNRASEIEIFSLIMSAEILGSIISYIAGRYFAKKIKLQNRSKIKEVQAVFSKWMKRYGSAAVLISRLVGYVRPWSSYLAGIGEIKFPIFILFNVIGSAIIVALTMLTLSTAVSIWLRYPVFRPLAIVLFIIFFFGFWVWLLIYRKYKVKK